ncbi:MAG: DNA repair protein RecO [Eubacterium sp.]|nr:DNA repair protein RecO [Eubacterium sp.]
MVDEIVTRGIILEATQLKEYDKRLVILTPELGRITVFANGARKKNSPFTAASQQFVMGSFTLFPGRNTYTLKNVEISEMFMNLSKDIEKMAYASYACEMISYFTREGIPAVDELNLLYVTIKAILAERQSLTLIKSIFEFKLLDIEGLGLEMTCCIKNGATDGLHHISPREGGLITDSETVNVKDAIYVSDDAIYAIRYILSRDIGAVYSFDVSINTCNELEKVLKRYLPIHIDRHFKSLDILKPLC